MTSTLNARAAQIVETMIAGAEDRRIASHEVDGGGLFLDCGIKARGGLRAGLDLARVCLGGLAEVTIPMGEIDGRAVPLVQVWTDHPVRACLASQYAGWAISEGKYFAMGSGPMRAVRGKEPVFDAIGFREESETVVGVLETRKAPPPEVVAKIAHECGVEPWNVTLVAAPTASLAGGFQITARSVETALHKLAELKFDLGRIVSAHGTAPLPPIARDDLAAIGRTNDAILYGARVVLHVTGDDESLQEIGPRVPSSASRDFGEPFAAIFARYNNDFYAVDPHLFSPAEVAFQNLDTGRTHVFGAPRPEIVARSFWG
ncbi:methenyltetrahydromethanopterin cyclohydrolase [Planctomyces sp. SH-PL62]|uniref:methenyltetrahydromethanopterin cyclohydrolase n=1 Tax=Planctomyces sp. SH-PL62 TaxID=1636152 RepID=UPI00078E4E5E|nr:methenyltetrahydromethanopterin cyclohydrolase [Planctomyces sp. SH-PL62]AMV36857.1 Methenyltetrahydromethanopterin cyclohydrolase [Planctomyces sp. SH-PL62]